MDPRSTSESSIPFQLHDTDSGPSHYIEQDDSAPQSLAGLYFGDIQRSNVNLTLESSSHPPHPYTPSHESAHQFFSGYVPNHSHHQWPPYPPPASLSTDPHSQTDHRTAPAQWGDTRWRDANQQMEQARMVTHTPFSSLPQWTHGVAGSSSSASGGSPSTISPDVLPSPARSYTPSGVLAEAREDPGTERASASASPTKPLKKRKDMLRKRDQRADDRQHFARICDLLEIPVSPKKTLAHRILVSVEELVKQRKLDDALRRRLGVGESDLAVLRGALAQDSIDAAPGRSDIRDADEGHHN